MKWDYRAGLYCLLQSAIPVVLTVIYSHMEFSSFKSATCSCFTFAAGTKGKFCGCHIFVGGMALILWLPEQENGHIYSASQVIHSNVDTHAKRHCKCKNKWCQPDWSSLFVES